jgi:hypothetical protein
MQDRISAAQYLAMMKNQPSSRGGSGRTLRLPASFLEDRTKAKMPLTETAQAPQARQTGPTKVSSAEKARERVASTVMALEQAGVEVDYKVLEGGGEKVVIRVSGGETLPPNRAANIGREQAKSSQRMFSRYKHACADRMADAAMLLRAAVVKAGGSRFNRGCVLTQVVYLRQVSHRSRCIDADAVAYSFKYVLDGLVAAGVLVDDSRQYVRIADADQAVDDVSMLVIELETKNTGVLK